MSLGKSWSSTTIHPTTLQHKNLMLENLRAAFPVMLGITVALIAIVWLAARPIALWFGSQAVEGYLHLAIVGLLTADLFRP